MTTHPPDADVRDDFDRTVEALHDGVAADLFGTAAGDPRSVDRGRHRFRSLAGIVHPDRVDATRRPSAHRAFVRLNELWQEWLIDAGVHSAPTTITTAARTY